MGKPLARRSPTAGQLSTVDEVLAAMRARGRRATSAKRVVLDVLFGTDDHLTVEEIEAAVQARTPEVHLTTVYRILDELEQLGVVVHTHLGHGPATYQLAAHAHAHLICSECGTRLTAPPELFADLAQRARERLGFEVDPNHFAILGRCAACGSSPTTP